MERIARVYLPAVRLCLRVHFMYYVCCLLNISWAHRIAAPHTHIDPIPQHVTFTFSALLSFACTHRRRRRRRRIMPYTMCVCIFTWAQRFYLFVLHRKVFAYSVCM